jgi:hypothetical protein
MRFLINLLCALLVAVSFSLQLGAEAFSVRTTRSKLISFNGYNFNTKSKFTGSSGTRLELSISAAPVLRVSKVVLRQARNIFQYSFWKAVLASIAIAAYTLRSKFANVIAKSGDNMEAGWLQRGKGSAFGRTVEVWRFAIVFAFKWVIFEEFLLLKFYLYL